MNNKDIALTTNRIVYVDPNDVRGTVNNVPLTPDYTNYSIWCDLVVERTSRLKNQASGTSYDELYVASWDMSRNDIGTPISFLQGKDAEAYNFLTTDYTNIDFDEIKKRNIIEGLQIESVNIGFTNYQTPQVTIKFIDIRGGGFFGREEATHNEFGRISNVETDKNGNPFDNFFSCFVSFPYPRFRLQVKGFYGRPVTFQLTCTNFSGKFNSSTGNFEITVQFIGYEYGVLGDIPFDLLVCAPLTKIGGKYWDEHVKNMANNGWALDKHKSEKPVKLIDFFHDISDELQNVKSGEVIEFTEDDATEAALSGMIDQIEELNQIKVCIEEFKELAKQVFQPYYVTEYSSKDENVLIIYNPTELYPNTGKIQTLNAKYDTLITMQNAYYEKYEPSSDESHYTRTINKIKKEYISVRPNVTFTNFLMHRCTDGDKKNKNSHSNVIVALNTNNRTSNEVVNSESSFSGIKIGEFYLKDDEYVISDGVSKQMYHDLSIRNWAIYGEDFGDGIPFAGYALAINLGEGIDNKITELNNSYNNYTEKTNDFKPKKISEILGFTPYVGRYFKVVMCHLETLMELFYQCADAIYGDIKDKKRLPNLLGIADLNLQTDIPSSIYDQVPPFPAVYKKYTTQEEEDKNLNNGKDIVANTWIGDFQGKTKWREEQLVNDLSKAAKRVNDARKEQAELGDLPLNYVNNSVFPIDYLIGIPQYAYTSIDGAMFYAAWRAEIQLDFMSGGNAYNSVPYQLKDWSYSFGVIDGYLYATNCANTQFLKNLISINNLSDKLYNSTVYCADFIKEQPEKYYYEIVKTYNERHPVFIEDGNKVKYNYMTNTSTGRFYIPLVNFKTFNHRNGFAHEFNYETGTDFEPKDANSNGFLYGIKENEETAAYPNAPHFTVITDEAKVRNIKSVYKTFKSGEINIFDKPADYYEGVVEEFSTLSDGSFILYYHYRGTDSIPTSYMSSYNTLGAKSLNFSNENELINLINKVDLARY